MTNFGQAASATFTTLDSMDTTAGWSHLSTPPPVYFDGISSDAALKTEGAASLSYIYVTDVDPISFSHVTLTITKSGLGADLSLGINLVLDTLAEVFCVPHLNAAQIYYTGEIQVTLTDNVAASATSAFQAFDSTGFVFQTLSFSMSEFAGIDLENVDEITITGQFQVCSAFFPGLSHVDMFWNVDYLRVSFPNGGGGGGEPVGCCQALKKFEVECVEDDPQFGLPPLDECNIIHIECQDLRPYIQSCPAVLAWLAKCCSPSETTGGSGEGGTGVPAGATTSTPGTVNTRPP